MEKLILLLLFLLLLYFTLNSQLTMGEGTVKTTGTIQDICTQTLHLADKQIKPLGTEDESAITQLLGCETLTSSSTNSANCKVQSSDTVTCDCSLDKDVCRVTEIDFAGRNLHGQLSEIMENLTHLTSLTLSDNSFGGPIPLQVASLKNLISLDLSSNSFGGPIPTQLASLKNLTHLDLSSNSFGGPIPTQLASLKSLTHLDLSNNSFGGPIPTQLASLKSLTHLDLSNNSFGGPIPTQLASLKNLISLDLSSNSFGGPIPTQLASLKNLTHLDLSSNSFGGPIPTQLASLKSLTHLDLYENLFNGSFPTHLSSLVNLQYLDLSGNLFDGPIPPQLNSFVNLVYLDISNNDFSGPLPDKLENLVLLKYLNIRGTNLSGRIPDFTGQLQNLTQLILMGNNFEGPLTAATFSSLTNLEALMVSDLVGGGESQFPNFTNMHSLQYLTLRNCLLAGPIPDIIWNLRGLYLLDLSFNSLFGQIPNHPTQIPQYIFLRRNKLNGTIPKWIINSTMKLDVSENLFTNNVAQIQKLHSNSSTLNFFSSLNSSDDGGTHWEHVGYTCNSDDPKYQLYDHLFINCGGESMPINGSNYEGDLNSNGSSTFFLSSSLRWGYSSMGSYSSINDEYIMSNTYIVGFGDEPLYSTARVSPISLKYYGFCLENGEYTVKLHFAELVSNGNYKTDRVFDVDIQGKSELKNFNIEKEAGGVNKACTKEIGNVIVNNSLLEIHLYWSGKGSIMYQGPLISAISVYIPKERGLSPPKMVAISLSVLILLLVLIVYFWKIMEDNSHEGMVELYPGGLYNFQKVKVAAKNFKHNLGNGAFGTFYEATLGNGMVVAVEKVSATKDIIRAFRENDSTISLKEHPNFVKLMGCIAEKNQLLLVYEDIGHNSLQNALFGSDRSRLNWPKRHNICLGIAEGLAFLHEGKQKNVHGNIKPTTIFLDKQDNAKISDFRFSRLHDQGKLREEGTVVYMAPEYAKYDLLTTKADVYSFGVVVLIVVSGKKEKISMCSSGTDTEYLPDLAAREKQREGHFMNLVDKSISNTVDWNEADTMLELALMCLDQYPDQRPTMSQVVKVLKEQLPLKDLKESLKQHSDPQPHGEISTT